MSRSTRGVFKSQHRRWDVFSAALKVDQSQALSRASAATSHRHLAVHVSSAELNFSRGQLVNHSAVK
jgi:hypothetical protein